MKSLIFFAFIIGIDLFLKSLKDKKKIQEIREKKIQELKSSENTKTVKQAETRVKREIQRNPSISRNIEKDNFFGEGKSYREDHKGYEERYDRRYGNIDKSYDSIGERYKEKKSDSINKRLYDPNAIQQSPKKEYKELDVKNYEISNEKIDVPVPKASTFKKDVLNGIIFSEILGKPKSLQNK